MNHPFRTIELANSTIISSILDLIGVNYSVIDTEGRYITQNKSMEIAISKGLILAENIDKPSWENCKRVMANQQREVKEEKFKDRYFLSVKQPLIEGSNCVGILVISFDITVQKQAEIAKQEFLMNMAHDLRTPLAGIIGLSSIQADSKMEPQEQQEYGQMIQGASEQLLELLNSVIEVTATEHQVEQLKKEPIDLSQLSDELQTLMQPSLQSKGLQFQVKVDSILPVIISDRIKLKRLLLNILSNAVKFTLQGRIALEINQLSAENNRAKIEIQISDTGIGITKDNIDKIFERFYRVHPSYEGEYKGYGIGLYLVKKTVELLNGEIKVASEEGKGSCFTLSFNFSVANEDPDKNKAALQES